jgi:predicted O-methyltransferase YrrM
MGIDMGVVEQRFINNTAAAIAAQPNAVHLTRHKNTSDAQLPMLLANGLRGHFDLVYVDGSHQAPDVLLDLVLSWQLLAVGGMLVMDDYLWAERYGAERDPIQTPKPAIDAFVNINIRKMNIMPYRLFQLYVQKISD